MNVVEISDLDENDIRIYSKLSEVQLLRFYEPDPGIFIAESPNVILRAIEGGYEPLSLLVQEDLLEKEAVPILDRIAIKCGEAKADSITVFTAKLEVINKMTGYSMVRGILCAMRRRKFESIEDFLAGKNKVAILYDIVNPTNVGAIVRSAAGLGIDGVLLTSGCSDPFYRRAARVSMGTVFQVPLIKDKDTDNSIIDRIHGLGFTTAAMALKDDSLNINDSRLKDVKKLAIVLGTEGDGLPEKVIEACNYTVKIPMYHMVDSLNVAAASAVAFYEICSN